jgi:hypothetical protein
MNTMPSPCARRSRNTANRRSVSSASRLEVGSSRISTRHVASSARAIAASCCVAIEHAPSVRSTSTSTRRRARADAARRRAAPRSTNPKRVGSRPSVTFSAIDSVGTRSISWKTARMPASSASRGDRGAIGAPTSAMEPESTRCSPVNTRINVLLPAPFSPISAWTSPASRSKSTPSSARTPGKSTTILEAARRGPVVMRAVDSPWCGGWRWGGQRSSGRGAASVLPPGEHGVRDLLAREHALFGLDAARDGLAFA